MANVKAVEITGTLPFDMGEDEEMVRLLGEWNMPACGLRITWTGEAGYKPNEHGGRTAMYNFRLSGTEAVAWAYLDRVVSIIKRIGDVKTAKARDIEDSGGWQSVG